MADWKGLLNYSLKYSDGTKKSEVRPMSEEDKKWLEKALEEYTHSEVRRIREIIVQLAGGTVSCELLEELEELLESLDRGDTFYLLGGGAPLLAFLLQTKDQKAAVVALRIFSFVNQNDAKVQAASNQLGAFRILSLIVGETSREVKEAAMGAISALVRGEYLQGKRNFIELDGLKIVAERLRTSQRFSEKALTLLSDLLFYDNRLGRRVNDTSAFSNTNSVRVTHESVAKNDLKFDPNQVADNEPEQLRHFVGCVQVQLAALGLLQTVVEHNLKMISE